MRQFFLVLFKGSGIREFNNYHNARADKSMQKKILGGAKYGGA